MAAKSMNMPPKLISMTIDELALGLKDSQFTSVQLVNTYIARIRQVNGYLKVIGEINPNAIDAAQELDNERSRNQTRGPLHGIPILIKDAFSNLDDMEASVGSSCLKGAKVGIEAAVIKRLKAAGAIILGITNPTEWCNLRTSRSPHGISANWGQSLGAYYPNQDPGGSSSGSCVATAIGLAAASLGTETFGSITMPSQRSAVVGFKPTPGLVSRVGMIVANEYQDTPGPITRTVKDAAYVLQAIAGEDLEDFAPFGYPRYAIPDYVAACKPEGLSGVRVAAPSQVVTQDAEVQATFKRALETIRQSGATVLTDIKFSEWTTSTRDDEHSLLNLGFLVLLKKNIESFLGQLKTNPHSLKTLADVIEYIKRTPNEEYEKFGATEFEAADALEFNTLSPEFAASMERRNHLGRDVTRLLDDHNCDVLVIPGSGDAPGELGGHPTVIVPSGFYSNDKKVETAMADMIYRGPRTPHGIMFIGRHFTEELLFSYAYAYEQASQIRNTVQPCIQSNIELDISDAKL